MSSWRECKLWDVAEVKGGKRLPKGELLTTEKTPHPYIRITDFDGHKINLSAIQYVTEEVQKSISRYIVNKQDIIISNVGTIGLCAKIPDELDNANLTENCVKLVFDKNKIDTNFLYYHLISPDTQELINSLDVGSTQPKLPIYNIQKIDISLPPLEEQKAIAEVLCSFDNKIDLLHRQNQTLESLAQTLFRQWFIEEAKEEWEEKPLGDIAVVQNGYAFSSKDYVEFESGYLEVFKMGHIEPGGGLRFSPKADFVPGEEKLEKWTLNEDDIVMAMTDMKDSMGILGHPAMIDKSNKYVLNQRVARIYLENQNNLLNNYLLYLQLSSREAIESLQSLANGGVQVNLSTEAIKSVSIIVPPKEFQKEKANFFDEYLQKMKNNRQEIQTLENLRDTLLSKLLSGEVRIKV